MRTRLFVISGTTILLLAIAFLTAAKYAFDPARHNYRLEFTGVETNSGVVEASFKFETKRVLLIEQLGFNLHREIEVTNRWITDETWAVLPRVTASMKDVRFYIPIPQDRHRWRLSADLSVKPYYFEANHFAIATDPLEPLAGPKDAQPTNL
jgi:hypothetical protein